MNPVFTVSRGMVLLSCLALTGCGAHEMPATFYVVDGYRFTPAEQRLIQSIADAAVRDARRVLPALLSELILRVNPGSKVIAESGETGDTALPNVVYWTVNPHRPGGVAAVARTHLRASLFHELHHLVRRASRPVHSLMDTAVSEGLATAFERDFAGAHVPWGEYPADVHSWVEELMALPPDAPRNQWLSRHPDGRRWIGYKAGTYLADRASRASRMTAAGLVSTPTDDVIRMAMSTQ